MTEPRKPLAYYIDGRLFEWSMAIPMIVCAMEIFVWPETLKGSAFVWVVGTMSSEVLASIMLLAGTIRVIALIANGRSLALGPRLRALGALAGAVVWVQFAAALFKLSITQGYPSPGVPFWVMFTIAELRITYRAVLDVRISN